MSARILPMAGPSNPERDRRLASKVRHGGRWAADAGHLAASFMSSPQMKRAKKTSKVVAIIRQVVGERRAENIRPTKWKGSNLTLEVPPGPLLSELKQFYSRELINALVEAGTGITRINWAPKRGRR